MAVETMANQISIPGMSSIFHRFNVYFFVVVIFILCLFVCLGKSFILFAIILGRL